MLELICHLQIAGFARIVAARSRDMKKALAINTVGFSNAMKDASQIPLAPKLALPVQLSDASLRSAFEVREEAKKPIGKFKQARFMNAEGKLAKGSRAHYPHLFLESFPSSMQDKLERGIKCTN